MQQEDTFVTGRCLFGDQQKQRWQAHVRPKNIFQIAKSWPNTVSNGHRQHSIFSTHQHTVEKKCVVPWAAQLSLLGPIGTLNRACEEGQKSKASWPYGIRHVLCTGSGGCDSHFRRFLLCTISIQRLLPRIL